MLRPRLRLGNVCTIRIIKLAHQPAICFVISISLLAHDFYITFLYEFSRERMRQVLMTSCYVKLSC